MTWKKRATEEDPCLHFIYFAWHDCQTFFSPWSFGENELCNNICTAKKAFLFFSQENFFLIQITSFKTLSLEVMHFPPKILKILSKNYWKEFPLSLASSLRAKRKAKQSKSCAKSSLFPPSFIILHKRREDEEKLDWTALNSVNNVIDKNLFALDVVGKISSSTPEGKAGESLQSLGILSNL